ncbi:MAG: pitrilysin family protein [Planctomycetota bacterium]
MSGKNRFEIERDELLGEEVWLARTSRGLPVRVVPTQRFRETAAVLYVGYGSTDLRFELEGREIESPEGVAHYLEHKLFEDEALAAFDRFSSRGARVNASTSFSRTSYFFTATDQIAANLQDLLHLVSHAHITEENVEKERGIIAQELRMYEDSPDFALFFDFLGGLYARHPVRHPVGGTVESIQDVTAEHLLECHRAFYRTGNAALAVCGPVEPEAILDLAEACALPEGDAVPVLRPADLGPIEAATQPAPRAREVPRAKMMLGCKDRDLTDDAEQRRHRQLMTDVALDRLFSAASEVREDLRHRGVIDDSLSAGYLCDASFGFSSLTCETDDPDATAAALTEVVQRPPRIEADYLERVRAKLLGRYVRSFGSSRGIASAQAEEAVHGLAPFQAMRRVAALTSDEIEARHREHFRAEALAQARLLPA